MPRSPLITPERARVRNRLPGGRCLIAVLQGGGPRGLLSLFPFLFFFRSFKTVPLASGDACQKKTTETFFFFFFAFFPSLFSHFFPFLLVSLVPFPLRAPVNGVFFVRVFFKVGRNAPAQLTRSWEFADNGYREGGFAKAGGAGAPWHGCAGTVTIMR